MCHDYSNRWYLRKKTTFDLDTGNMPFYIPPESLGC